MIFLNRSFVVTYPCPAVPDKLPLPKEKITERENVFKRIMTGA